MSWSMLIIPKVPDFSVATRLFTSTCLTDSVDASLHRSGYRMGLPEPCDPSARPWKEGPDVTAGTLQVAGDCAKSYLQATSRY